MNEPEENKIKHKSVLVPIGAWKTLVLYADWRDIHSYEDYDPETNEAYWTASLCGRWVGNKPEAWSWDQYCADLSGKLLNSGMTTEERITSARNFTPAKRRKLVRLLQKMYMYIVQKLGEDLEHNIYRAHHQGVYQGAYDRKAVIEGIERWLISSWKIRADLGIKD